MAQRKDFGKDNVIISEKTEKRAKQFLAKDLPYPYTSVAQYEASFNTPVGAEWNSRKVHQRETMPRVIKKVSLLPDYRSCLVTSQRRLADRVGDAIIVYGGMLTMSAGRHHRARAKIILNCLKLATSWTALKWSLWLSPIGACVCHCSTSTISAATRQKLHASPTCPETKADLYILRTLHGQTSRYEILSTPIMAG